MITTTATLTLTNNTTAWPYTTWAPTTVNYPATWGYTQNIVTSESRDLISIMDAKNSKILSITNTGEVIWHQNTPSAAAKKLIAALQGAIDNSAVVDGALERCYIRALEKCCKLLESGQADSCRDQLQTEIIHRKEKLCLNLLTKEWSHDE
jgi:hypothetical protein